MILIHFYSVCLLAKRAEMTKNVSKVFRENGKVASFWCVLNPFRAMKKIWFYYCCCRFGRFFFFFLFSFSSLSLYMFLFDCLHEKYADFKSTRVCVDENVCYIWMSLWWIVQVKHSMTNQKSGPRERVSELDLADAQKCLQSRWTHFDCVYSLDNILCVIQVAYIFLWFRCDFASWVNLWIFTLFEIQ